MSKLKKLAAFLLTAALALSLSVTAFAAVEDTGFSDVNANAWYENTILFDALNSFLHGIIVLYRKWVVRKRV